MPRINRSLERGLAILDSFRPGTGVLSHREVTERSGLPKPTVTRLLATLKESGYLTYDALARGYRLGSPILSLAYTFELESALRRAVAPVVARAAQDSASIIGFGTAHALDIVYVAASNGDPARGERFVGPGMRAPIATTAVGRAYLAGLPEAEREQLLARLELSWQWRAGMKQKISRSLREVVRTGYCLIEYRDARATALGLPLKIVGSALHAVSLSFSTGDEPGVPPPAILDAVDEIRHAIARFNEG